MQIDIIISEIRAKMRCHFVYSIPMSKGMYGGRLEHKIRRVMNDYKIPISLLKTRQPATSEMEKWDARHPGTLARSLYQAFSNIMPTYLYHIKEQVRCNFEVDDIFIGHPYFPSKINKRGVTEISLNSVIRPRLFSIISPLHCDTEIGGTHINREYLEDIDRIIPDIDILFSIMGEYWWDQWDKSKFKHWKNKMIRLDMAVDIKDFPRIKQTFNKPGSRGFLYIGVNESRKGTDFLSDLMGCIDDCPKGWIGSGQEIPNVTNISPDTPLTEEFMTTLIDTYDFFISPSRVDPNPTTILQSMAWGFPVVCTPQSGYYEASYRRHIYLDDIPKSVSILNGLQYAKESELIRMSDDARKVVETEYTWEKFTSTILDVFEQKMNEIK